MFLDQSVQVIEKARTKNSPPCAASGRSTPSNGALAQSQGVVQAASLSFQPCMSLPISQSLDDLAVNFFMANFVGSNASQSQFDYLPNFYQQPGHHEHFYLSLYAVGLAGYSAAARSPELLKAARVKYVSAIRQVNSALTSSEMARKDSTLISVMLLGMFEVIVSPNQQSLETLTKHLNGAIELAKLRSKEQFETDIGKRLFKSLSLNVVSNCLIQGNPIPEEFIALRKHMPNLHGPDAPGPQFLDLMIRWLEFAHDCNANVYPTPSAIMAAALDLDGDMQHFGETMPPKWQYNTIHTTSNPELVYEGFYHLYEACFIAQLWNNWRLARIRCHKVVLDQLLLLIPTSMSPNHFRQLQSSKETMQQLISDICATVPQLAGYLPYLSTETLASDPSHPSSISISYPVLRHTSPKAYQQRVAHHFVTLWASYAAIQPSEDHPGRSQVTQHLRPAGGYHLLWPLYMISQMTITPPAMRSWVVNQMKHVGQGVNPDYVNVIMNLMRKKGVGFESGTNLSELFSGAGKETSGGMHTTTTAS